MILLPITAITDPGTITGSPIILHGGTKELSVIADFVYGSGGTTCKCFIQTKIGLIWTDIMNFAFLVSSIKKISAIHKQTALVAAVVSPGPPVPQNSVIIPTDGTLSDDMFINGLLGQEVRVKVISTGSYVNTTMDVRGN